MSIGDELRQTAITTKKDLTIDGTNDQNIFKISGVVQINFLYGYVTTVLDTDITAAYLQIDDADTPVAITKIVGAPALSSLPVGSFVAKASLASAILEVQDATTCKISETLATIFSKFIACEKTGSVDTYISLIYAGAGNSGVIHWHCDWERISDDGDVAPA
jgi:hypothetical protein